MATKIRSVEYFHATVADAPGGGYDFLAELAENGVNLLAFTAIPIGPNHTNLQIFPDDPRKLIAAAQKTGTVLTGPQQAFLVQGSDEIGAIARVHAKLRAANVSVFASNGVADGRGGYGYIIYVRPGDFESAARALEVEMPEAALWHVTMLV